MFGISNSMSPKLRKYLAAKIDLFRHWIEADMAR